jgi:hypothetical protein
MQLLFSPDHPETVAKTQVALPKGSFIRALPFVVDETQRLRVDALVVCADILSAAYAQLIELALRSKREEVQGKEQARHLQTAMFQHAWSMVDQVYIIRLLLRSLQLGGEDVDAFMAATDAAYVLRNRMDHLNAGIPNIAKSKSQNRSLFGSISFFVLGSAIGSPEVDVYLALQQSEPIRPQEQLMMARIPAEMRLPIGNFSLHVAGKELDLDRAILTLGPVMTRTNDGLEKSIKAQVAEKATELGIEESRLLAHFGAAYGFMLALQVGKPPVEPHIEETNQNTVPEQQ